MTLDDAKTIGQIVAWFGAGIFFLYKVVAGYMVGSASLRLTCNRAPQNVTPDMDYLAVVAIVKRGTGSTFVLHEARARVTNAHGAAVPDWRELPLAVQLPAPVNTETTLIASQRLSSRTSSDDVLQVKFHQVSDKQPLLNLAPGDEMQFAALYEIRRDQPCVVEVAVIGKSRGGTKRALWCASDVSLPITPKN